MIMNHSNNPAASSSESSQLPEQPCEICSGKSDEDLYIVFNALCKILVDAPEQQNHNTESPLTENLVSLNSYFRMDKSPLVIQQNVKNLQKTLSREGLTEVMALPRFDLLLREIFKIKYNRAHEITCKHRELALNFIKKFNLKTDVIFEESDLIKKNLIKNSEKIDLLYSKVKQFKLDIESYHTQIDGLSGKIISKLLSKNSHHNKEEEIKQKKLSEDQETDLINPFINKKVKKDEGDSKDVPSSFMSRRKTSSTESERSDEESSDESPSAGNRKTKVATFKSKLPKKATDILKEWFLSNIKNPYPHHDEKENLSKITGLTRKQIQNWFTNSRKRFLEPLKKKIDGTKRKEDLPKGLESLGSEAFPQIGQEFSVSRLPEGQSALLNKQIASFQIQQKANLLLNSLQNSNQAALMRQNELQMPSILTPQSSLCPTTIQTIYQPTHNIFVLPWAVTPPVYPFQPNILPIAPSHPVTLNQSAVANNYPLMRNIPILSNQYIQPVQPNVNQMLRQQALAQISNNFNQRYQN